MATSLDIDILKVINAGHFWAHPLAQPELMGKLNDHFRNAAPSEIISPLVKGQMCVVRRTSDKCWYRARVQNVLQTLCGPQASVFLVDLAQSTLIPCCWIREVPSEFQNIPFQAMDCFLTGLKPLQLVTAYFDLTTSKQATDHWDEAATNFVKNLIQGCKLQVSIQRQDEKGQYHVLLMADSGRSQICINDELVLKGFATYLFEVEEALSISPFKAAKLEELTKNFQKKGKDVAEQLKEYISHGKFTSSEQSSSTDDEVTDHTRHDYLSASASQSPVDILRKQMSHSHSAESQFYGEPSARIPAGISQNQKAKPWQLADNDYLDFASETVYKGVDALSNEENSGHVRFLSSRLPATGSNQNQRFSISPSKSPESSVLKPILKKSPPYKTSQYSNSSSSELEDTLQRKVYGQVDEEDSRLSCTGTLEVPSLLQEKKSEFPSSSCELSMDGQLGSLLGNNLHSISKCASTESSTETSREDQRVSTSFEYPETANELQHSGTKGTLSRFCEAAISSCNLVQLATSGNGLANDRVNGHEQTLKMSTQHLAPSPCLPSSKSPLPSEVLLSKSPPSSVSTSRGRNLTFSRGVLIQTEGAPAPKPVFSLENSHFQPYLRKLNMSTPSSIQAHVWPALARGRDVVGVCPANEGPALAYLVPVIHQLVEEKEIYASLPPSSGPKVLILVPTWYKGDQIYYHCTQLLSRNKEIRVQLIFAGGAEDNQIIQLINGCEIMITTPPCFLRMIRRGFVNLNRLCHTIFNDADLMVEDFTSEIKDIMRHYGKLLKSQPSRSAPRQAVVMTTTWSVGVASLVKAYLGNPVLVISDMIEAAVYRRVQQIATVCYDSQRDVPLLGYTESFLSVKEEAKDICVFASTPAEAENVGEILKANCYSTLVAHEYLEPQELSSVKRQWNTPHSTDAMPVLVMTDGVIEPMNVTNASCVIHYNSPGSKTKLRKRLTTLAGTFTSSEDHSCISVLFVTDKCKPEFPRNVARLVRRSGQEVPSSLQDMVTAIKAQEVERKKELCHYLKAFGTCRLNTENRPCSMRHILCAKLDKPLPGIPSSGIVKVLVLSVESTSCYWVRILQHCPAESQNTGSYNHIADNMEFLELTVSISGWFADPLHRIKHEMVSVGDLCAIMLANSTFHRVKVCRITGRDGRNKQYVEIQYVDKGSFEVDVPVDRLLQLPSQFHSCPFQAVQVFVCRLQPLDKDIAWTVQGKHFVKHLIEGKEMEGRVVLSLGNTMWLDPLVERKHLKNINVTTNQLNVRMEILKEKYATDNKQHLKLLKNLCDEVIDLSSLEEGTAGLAENSCQHNPALETVALPEDGFHPVYVSAVQNPNLFFVQLKSSEESLEDLRQKINSGVGKIDSEENEVAIGSFCVAKFSEDDKWYRGLVMGSRPDDEYDVFFVDFGDQEWVTGDKIAPAWSGILQLPLQAVECSLVDVQPFGDDWKDEVSDAFWEMVIDRLLFAKVKSKTTSLMSGSHKFVIELYDTSTEHDVIISQEMIAQGHAQSSPEGTKMLFPYSTGGTESYEFPHQRIPDMCLQAHLCQDAVKKVEIVKEVQTIVLNSESFKDDICTYGGIQSLCRLLNLSRHPLVLQHILISLASLAFGSETICDEVRNQGGLQTICYLLEKCEDSATQESLAWALKNLAATERNQNEAKNRGGIKALCRHLKNTTEDRVQERVAWALGSLVVDHTSNCQAVHDCGGLKTLCELTAAANSENVLERVIWTLGLLAVDSKNRNFIRQCGGIENICKRLKASPSEQIIKQGALTLKTLASNNQYNKEVMCRLGMISTLRSLMNEDPQRLGIITHRVCWDLLQRLLGSAAGNSPGASPQVSTPAIRTQQMSSSPVISQSQELERKTVNGLMDSDDDLPPLGGEAESDKENDVTLVPRATVTINESTPPSCKQVSSAQVVRENVITSTRPITRPGSSSAEEEDFEAFRAHPQTVWSQTRDLVRVCVKLRDVQREHAYTEISANRLKFSTQVGRTLYALDLELLESIDPLHTDSKMQVKGSEVQINLRKKKHGVWTRLLKSKEKLPYVSIDFDRWEVWSSSEEDDENDGTRASPTNFRSLRKEPVGIEESKQVLLPEMLESQSSDYDSEGSYSSGVDCFDFS